MNQMDWLNRFVKDIDEMLNRRLPRPTRDNPPRYDTPPEYRELLGVARRLERVDASAESRVRQELRQRLMEQVHQPGQPRPPARSNLSLPALGWWAASGAALTVLALGLVWALFNLLPGRLQHASQQPAGPLTAGPLEVQVTPLTPASQPPEIVARAIEPAWSTLWADGSLSQQTSSGEWQTTYFQVWLDRSGFGRALESDPLPGQGERPQDLSPHFANLSDGQTLARFDLLTGSPDPAYLALAFSSSPLENAGPYMSLFYPYFLRSEGGSFAVAGETFFAGRPAIRLQWTATNAVQPRHRFLVDAETGLLLSHETLADDGVSVVRLLQIHRLDYQAAFPAALANPQNLPLASAFDESPQVPLAGSQGLDSGPLPTGTPAPQPTEYAVPPAGTLALQLDASQTQVETFGPELYYSLSGGGRQTLLRMDWACAASQAACPAQTVERPFAALDAPLAWSRDGRRAAVLDAATQRILLLSDPAAAAWQTLAENFTPALQIALWSPDGGALALSAQAGTGGSLLAVVDAASGALTVPAAELGADQIPLGWLDNQTLLFLQVRITDKGLSGDSLNPQVPALFLLDTAENTWKELSGLEGWSYVTSYPAVSPDGSRLALLAGETPALSVYDFNTGSLTPLAAALTLPQWSPDGEWLAGVAYENGLAVLEAVNVQTGEVRRLFEWPSAPVFAWSPDGRFLAVEVGPTPEQAGASQYIIALDGGEPRQVIIEGGPAGAELRHPAFRPAQGQ